MLTLFWKVVVLSWILLTCLVPTSDSYFSMLVLSITSIISLSCLYYLFIYYNNLPQHRQNILIFLTQMLIFFHGFNLIQELIKNILLQCFKNQIIELVDNQFLLVCYVWRLLHSKLVWFICIVEIMIFKILLIRGPVLFLYMNNLVIKVICVLIPIIPFGFKLLDFKSERAKSNGFLVIHDLLEILKIKFKQEHKSKLSNLNLSYKFLIFLICIEFYNSYLCSIWNALNCFNQ
jgi:hypothetical protein